MEEKENFSLDEVSLYSILRDLVVHLWVIVLAGVSAWLAVGGVAQLCYVPEYSSTAIMAVSAKGTQVSIYSNLLVTNQMAGVIGEVFASNVLRQEIQEELDEPLVDTEIQANVIEETNLLTVQVTAPTPKMAHQVLGLAIANYENVSDYLFSNASLHVLQQPTVPAFPSNPSNFAHLQKMGALGAMAVVAVICVACTLFRPTVQTPESARRNVDEELLGIIPYEWKWKALKEAVLRPKRALLLTHPRVSMAFAEGCRRMTTRLEFRLKRHRHKVLLVTSVGENEGKSSIAINVALALAEKGRKVLLLDGDLKKPAIHKILELPPNEEQTLKQYLTGTVTPEKLIQREPASGLYVVQAGEKFVSDGAKGAQMVIRRLVQEYAKTMDYIVVDSAPMSVSSDTEYLLAAVDSVLFVVRQDWCSSEIINEKILTIRQHKVSIAGVVLNAVHPLSLNLDGRSNYYKYARTYGKRQRGEVAHEHRTRTQTGRD